MMISRLVTPPNAEPFSTAEAKAHLRLETTADDTYVDTLVKAAREYTEKLTWRALINQTWELVLSSGFPSSDFIELPKGSLVSVTSVTYLDQDGATQTLNAATYEVDTKSPRGRVILKDGEQWPATKDRWNSVTVTYVAGYGAGGAQVPNALKQAMLLLIAQMYEHRVPEVVGTIATQIKFAFDALVAPYRLARFKR